MQSPQTRGSAPAALTVYLATMHDGIWNALHWLGAALAVSGLAGAVVARIQLGGAFSVKAQPKGLVTQGLYF